jgi:hypothetical protein
MSLSGRNRGLTVTAAVVAGSVVAAILANRSGYKIGRNTPVRCRRGHLFTTIWIPGGSLKADRAPLHPVKDADLTDAEREFATSHHDVMVP